MRPIGAGAVRASRPVAGLWGQPFLLIFLFAAAWQAALPFVAIHADRMGMGPGEIGLLFVLQSLFATIAIFPSPWLVHRWGARGSILAASLAASLVFALMALLPSPPTYMIGMSLYGSAQSLMFIACKVFVAAPRPSGFGTPAHVVGTFMFFTSLGVAAGPMVASAVVLYRGSVGSVFWLSLAASAVAVFLALLLRSPRLVSPEPGAAHGGLAPLLPLTAPIQTALVATAAADFVFTSWIIVLPILMDRAGQSPATVGLVFAMRGAATALIRPAIGLIDRVADRETVAAGALLMSSLGLAVSLVFVASSGWVMGGAVLVGMGMGVVFPMTVLLMATPDIAPWRLPGLLAAGQLAGRVGAITAPATLGLVGLAGPGIVGVGMLAMGWGVSSSIVVRRRRRNRAISPRP